MAYLQTLDSGVVFTEAQGEQGVSYVCISLAMFNLCLFNLGGFRLIEWDFRPELDGEDNKDVEAAAGTASEGSAEKGISMDTRQGTGSSEAGASDEDLTSLSSSDSVSMPVPISLIPISSSTTNNSATTTTTLQRRRTADIRRLPSQTVEDIINEYSEFSRPQQHLQHPEPQSLQRVLTSDVGLTSEDVKHSGPTFMQRYHLGIVVFFIKNCLRPCSLATIVALAIAFIPWVKALFVTTSVYMPNAPDELPPLNFLMDYTSYVGAASVPFALILLGGAIGRLRVNDLPPGFWKAALLLVVFRLCIMPILGVLWMRRLVTSGLIDTDDLMLQFVIVISWGLPSMTSQIYFTAFYTPLDAKERTQMNCISVFLLMQYPLLVVSLPFLVTYVIKVEFGY